MREKIGFKIEKNIKYDYKEFIVEKYNNKKGIGGLEIGKAMKFYLAAQGNKKYQNDPDVQAILKKANKNMNNPYTIKSKSETNNTLDERFEKLDALTEKIERKTHRESSKKHGHA